MSYQNINQYNFRKWRLLPFNEITDISLASDERDYDQEVVFSPLLIGEDDGNRMPFKFDFNSSGTTLCQTSTCSFSSDTIVSENYWNPLDIDPNFCPSATTLCDVGLTGIDNGLVKKMSGETIEITTGLYTNNTDKFSRYKYDRRFKLHPITGFTTSQNRLWNDNSYTYNLNYTTYGDEVGYFARLQGGFFQGFYKIPGYDYQIFPERVNLGWTAEFMLRYRWTGTTDIGLNVRYPDNKGTFFFMGARAENKFYHYADGSPKQDTGYTRVTSGLTCMHTCECLETGITASQSCLPVYQPSGVTSNTCNCGCPCSCPVTAEYAEEDPLYDGVSNAISVRFSGDTGNPRLCIKTYTITGNCVPTGSCLTDLTYQTGTTVSEWCSTKGIFDFCSGTTYSDNEHWAQIDVVFRRREWFELCDLYDMGGLGLLVFEQYTATTANNSLSLIRPPITHDDIIPATTEVVKFKDSWMEEKEFRLGDLMVYVNGRLFMVITDFEEIIPRLLNVPKEKQIGVGYNISVGGGTQGLHDNLTFSGECPPTIDDIVYQQDPECLTTHDLDNTIYSGLTTNIKLEEYFGGSFIGDVSAFRMYTEPLNASQIAHNFRILKNRYQLLDPNCLECVLDIPPNDLTYTLIECPTPTPTQTSTTTQTPTNTNTPTNTTTSTPTPTSTPTVPVTSNLVLYYDPSNPSSYSGSGTVINDLSGNGLNGTMSNITFTSPYFTFNGTSSQISVADNVLLEPGSGDWSIEFWVNHSVIAGASRILIAKTDGGSSADWGYGLRTVANSNTFIEVGNGTTSIASPVTGLSINTWYQVVGVWTNVASNSIALYINGNLIGSNSHSFTSIKNTTSPLYLGSFNGGQFPQWLNGRMGVVRMYNSALTTSQVLQNYNADKSKYGL